MRLLKMTPKRFINLIPKIRKAAKKIGYAIGTHGNFKRDYDLIAVPWTNKASHHHTLAEAVKKASGGVRWRIYDDCNNPHGRICYAFDWDRNNFEPKNYCDLSVMPRLKEN